jgi:hypothetical protein
MQAKYIESISYSLFYLPRRHDKDAALCIARTAQYRMRSITTLHFTLRLSTRLLTNMTRRGRGVAKRGGRGGHGAAVESRSDEDVRLSKKLSRMLRHHPPACIDKSGWVPIEVVKSALGSGQDTAQILRVVESDEKGRFQARFLVFYDLNMSLCAYIS